MNEIWNYKRLYFSFHASRCSSVSVFPSVGDTFYFVFLPLLLFMFQVLKTPLKFELFRKL